MMHFLMPFRDGVSSVDLENTRIPIKEIADCFGRDPVVMSKGLRRLDEKIRLGKEITQEIKWVEEALIKGKKGKIAI